MSETYNVRERSFIKMPEVKCCVACGQPLPSDVKPMNNHMNRYISEAGRVSVLNSNEDILKIKQGETVVPLYKVTGKDAKTGKEFSSFMQETVPTIVPKPTTPTSTTK